jgi:hypothetical protein
MLAPFFVMFDAMETALVDAFRGHRDSNSELVGELERVVKEIETLSAA